jgi:RNA polymerase sigma factor (sigma-70 family)
VCVEGVAATREEHRIGIFRPSEAHLNRVSSWFLADYEPLLRFAYFLTHDQSAAEDLVQEAFARVTTAADRLEEHGLSAYARRTVFNLHLSACRRRKLEQGVLHLLRPKDHEPSDIASAMDMRRALLSLPLRQRACLALRYYEDMKESQISSALGMSLAAVKKEIERAKRKLRVALGERGES